MTKELFKEYKTEARKVKDSGLKAQMIECLDVAQDFNYPQSVFNGIIEATSINRLNTVMHTAIKYI
mgnify:CR=1 FL=1